MNELASGSDGRFPGFLTQRIRKLIRSVAEHETHYRSSSRTTQMDPSEWKYLLLLLRKDRLINFLCLINDRS